MSLTEMQARNTGSSNMSSEKHEGQHSTEINRVIRRRACHNRFPHKWTYCGSPMANIFSRPGHNPRRVSRATKGRQREILSIVQKQFIVVPLREESASPRAVRARKTRLQNVTVDARCDVSR